MLKRTCRTGVAVAVAMLLTATCSGLDVRTAETPPTLAGRDPSPARAMTADTEDLLSLYLSPAPGRLFGDWQRLYMAILDEGDQWSLARRGRPVVLAAPLEPEPPVHLASFVYPQVTGLAGTASDERAVPLADTNVLALGPGGFGYVMTGKPEAGTQNWTHASETAISYIRPHVNIQMMLSLEMDGHEGAAKFEGPGFQSHAYLTVDHRKRVDSADIGAATERFGRRFAPVPIDEPQTAVAAGLDLGLLPTFLAQMGINLSVVASRGEETGDLKLALVGTTELPVDWLPPEEPRQHPVGLAVNPLGAPWKPFVFGPTSIGRGRPPGPPFVPPPGPPGPTPIIPIIPEPATLVLVAAGLLGAIISGRRRR